MTSKNSNPQFRSLRGLDWLNFFLADVQTGVGPFLAIFLAAHKWDEQLVGLALTVGSLSGIIAQTPAGAIVDTFRSKRALIAAGVVSLAICSLLIAFFPSFWVVILAQVLIGSTSSIFIPAICAISLGIVRTQFFDARQGRNQMFKPDLRPINDSSDARLFWRLKRGNFRLLYSSMSKIAPF